MKSVQKHISRCLIAGVVALLPVGGVVLSFFYLEKQLAGSWLKEQGYYFYGLGLLSGIGILYAVGLLVTTFLGRWIWGLVDALLTSVPLLGRLYQTLKQVLGYGEGPDAVFRRAVLVPCRDLPGHEIGLVTNECDSDGSATVFIPGAPNPSAGRVLVIERDRLRPLDVPVTDVLKCLVSIGALPLQRSVEDE